MRYTRRFWYGVQCALLVQWGTPYGRRYAPRAKIFNGRKFIACFHYFFGHSFAERLPVSPKISRLLLYLLPWSLAIQYHNFNVTLLWKCWCISLSIVLVQQPSQSVSGCHAGFSGPNRWKWIGNIRVLICCLYAADLSRVERFSTKYDRINGWSCITKVSRWLVWLGIFGLEFSGFGEFIVAHLIPGVTRLGSVLFAYLTPQSLCVGQFQWNPYAVRIVRCS